MLKVQNSKKCQRGCLYFFVRFLFIIIIISTEMDFENEIII
jgi:hypothetical protein